MVTEYDIKLNKFRMKFFYLNYSFSAKFIITKFIIIILVLLSLYPEEY